MDKSWMRKRKSSSEYIRGVIAFVKFASENSKRKEFIVCPCKKCSLGKTLSKEVVFAHLTSGAGIIEGYTEWIMHGEPIVASTDKEAISEASNTVRIDSIPLHGGSNGMQDMLNDVFERVPSLEREDGPGRESHTSTQSVPDPSQHSNTSRQPQVLRRGQVNTIDEQGRRSVRTVGSPTDIWHLPEGERVVIQFNPMFQPTGPGSEKFKRIAGKIIRTGQFVKLSGNWRKQPMENKEEMWTTLMRKFYVEPGQPIEEIKRVMFMDLAKKRRQFRYEVKNALKLKENDKVEDVIGKAERVEMFDAEDFEIQVERWLSEDDKRMAEKAKTSRSFNKFLHTLGSKSIAQLARDMEEETGETPNRSNLFVVTHTKKDGTPVNDLAGEAMKKIKAIMDTQSPTDRMRSQGSIYWSPNDACGQVLGKEHSGRVRGVGLGPTPGKSTLYTSGTSISSAPTPREEALTLEVTNLKGLYQEQKLLVQEQKQELADIKLMLKMIMEGKQPSMGNNQEGESLTVDEDNTEVGEDGT